MSPFSDEEDDIDDLEDRDSPRIRQVKNTVSSGELYSSDPLAY
jgi:hypothetical protein